MSRTKKRNPALQSIINILSIIGIIMGLLFIFSFLIEVPKRGFDASLLIPLLFALFITFISGRTLFRRKNSDDDPTTKTKLFAIFNFKDPQPNPIQATDYALLFIIVKNLVSYPLILLVIYVLNILGTNFDAEKDMQIMTPVVVGYHFLINILGALVVLGFYMLKYKRFITHEDYVLIITRTIILTAVLSFVRLLLTYDSPYFNLGQYAALFITTIFFIYLSFVIVFKNLTNQCLVNHFDFGNKRNKDNID